MHRVRGMLGTARALLFFNLLREDSPPCRAVFPCLGLVCCVCCCPPAAEVNRPDVVQPDVPEAARHAAGNPRRIPPVSEAEAQRLSRGLAPARRYALMEGYTFCGGAEPAYVRAKPSSRGRELPCASSDLRRDGKGLERLLRLLPFLDKAPEVLASDFRWFASARTSASPAYGAGGSRRPTSARAFPIPYLQIPSGSAQKAPYHTRHAIDCKGRVEGGAGWNWRGWKIRWTSSCSRFRGLDGCVLRTGRCALCCTTGRTGTSMWRLAGSWSIRGLLKQGRGEHVLHPGMVGRAPRSGDGPAGQ